MDKSNGYDTIAREFIRIRGNGQNGIGVPIVAEWAAAFPRNAQILDLGCGSGIPITRTLLEHHLIVYGIDASPNLVSEFRTNFPENVIRCEAVEESGFFGQDFDGILAWGLLFLLPSASQIALIGKVASHLKPGGSFLFTSPSQKVVWRDVMTGRHSQS